MYLWAKPTVFSNFDNRFEDLLSKCHAFQSLDINGFIFSLGQSNTWQMFVFLKFKYSLNMLLAIMQDTFNCGWSGESCVIFFIFEQPCTRLFNIQRVALINRRVIRDKIQMRTVSLLK